MLDLLLQGGSVVDGTGAPAFKADIGLQGDRIALIARNGADRPEAAHTLDITGHVVAPGVIDIHSHSDFTWLEERTGRSAVRQGVTTEVVGNCGQTYAPLTDLNLQWATDTS